MNLSINDLVVTDHQTQLSRSHDAEPLIRIRRGIYLPLDLIPKNAPPWRVRQLVTQARALSLSFALSPQQPPVLTLEAALNLHGIPTWINTSDICYRRDGPVVKKQPHVLPLVKSRGIQTPAVSDRRLISKRLTTTTDTLGGVHLSPVWEIAVDCARYLHPMAAVVAASTSLNRLARFDKQQQSGSRKRERRWRADILQTLDDSPRFKNSRRARNVIQIADAGVETPGEGYLLWLLHCLIKRASRGSLNIEDIPRPESIPTLARDRGTNISARQDVEIFTQYEIIAGGHQYFVDFAIPTLRVVIEFDGGEKIQTSRARLAFLERQKNLLDAGWNVIRVDSGELSHPQELISYLMNRLSALGVPVHRPQGPLWSPIPAELLNRDRRF